MRHIHKNKHNATELSGLRSRNSSPPNNSDVARNHWKKLGNKKSILNLLLTEQYGLCCYSEIRADIYGWGYHIEHIENKNQNPARTFDYTNLLASAFTSDDLSSNSLKQKKGVFGGHAQGKSGSQPIDMTLFISPLERDCANFFLYTSDGKINPHPDSNSHDQQRALYTIDILNLNSPELVIPREKLWRDLENLFDTIFELENPKEKWEDEAQTQFFDRNFDENGKLDSFFSLKRQFFNEFNNTAEIVLQKYNEGELI